MKLEEFEAMLENGKDLPNKKAKMLIRHCRQGEHNKAWAQQAAVIVRKVLEEREDIARKMEIFSTQVRDGMPRLPPHFFWQALEKLETPTVEIME